MIETKCWEKKRKKKDQIHDQMAKMTFKHPYNFGHLVSQRC